MSLTNIKINNIDELKNETPKEYILESLIESTYKNVLFVESNISNDDLVNLLDIVRCYIDYYGDEIKLRIIDSTINNDENIKKLIVNKIKEYDLSNNVELISDINNSSLISYYLGSDVLLVFNDKEELNGTVMEAQYFGLPIVASGKNSNSELIGDNQIILGNDIFEYVAAIKVITENEKYAAYLERQGRTNYLSKFIE